MFDCLAACNNVCVTCIWGILLSTCYPRILGTSGDNSRKDADVSESEGKLSSLLEYSLGSVNVKVPPNPDDQKDPNCRRITIPRPSSKETI